MLFERDLHEGTAYSVCMTNHFSACSFHFYSIKKKKCVEWEEMWCKFVYVSRKFLEAALKCDEMAKVD